MTTLYLIDGHNVLYRTFFGLPRLSAPDGTPTHVVLGTARILMKILREERPAAIAAVFDTPEPTPRHALFPEYKANRLKAPEDLSAQVPLVKETIDALGVPRIEIPGVEADDIIGTLSRIAEEEGMRVVIVSSDKDLYQLVSDRVVVRDGLKERAVGPKEVRETFGVEPRQVVDLLALAGDPSDNVPGVPGIGEKTAAALLSEFGTLEDLLVHTDRLSGSRRKKIEEHADAARLCRSLVEIDRHVAIDRAISDLAPRGIRSDRIVPLFSRLGFRKLLEELAPLTGAAGKPEPPVVPSPAWERASSARELLGRIRADGEVRLGVAPGGDPDREIAVSAGPSGSWILPAGEFPELLRRVGRAKGRLYLFDAKRLLARHDPVPTPEIPSPLFDLLVAGHLLAPDEGTPTLSKLWARYLPSRPPAGAPSDPRDRSAAAAAETAALGPALEGALEEAGLTRLFFEVDMPLLPVLVRMEKKGIRIDPAVFAALSRELAEGTRTIERKVAAVAGEEFNINSPKQLAVLLFEKLGLPPVKKTKTGYSTDVEVLERLKGLHEIPGRVLEYRTLAKIRSTYVEVLPNLVDPRDGRIHTTFHLTQTATGRLSSSDPNLQNIPVREELGRRIRSGFVAGEGCLFVGADYSQVELRLLAHLSGDAELVRRFREGEDIHAATAAAVFGVPDEGVTPELRRRAKVINFGILYGMSPFGLSRELGISPGEARSYIEHYFSRYPGVHAWVERVKEEARRDGYVATLLGRRRPLRDIGSRNKVLREAAERMAVNTPIQGSAADIIKLAMIRVDREFRKRKMEARLVLQIHDELIAELPREEADEAERILREAMEKVFPLSVPLTVSVSRGNHWGAIH
ncbi:MAG: DNA polymerase I [Deltaproteobacteria bacterium]